MEDSSSFTSLLALVDSHLSKTNLQEESQPPTSGARFKVPSFGVQKGQSDTGLPSTSGMLSSIRFPVPRLSLSERPVNAFGSMWPASGSDQKETEKPSTPMNDRPISDILAIQLSNMFKAREAKEAQERKRQQELERVEENTSKVEKSSCLIDLMPAVQKPGQVQSEYINTLSSGSSMESIVIPETSDNDEEMNVDIKVSSRPVSPLKPITTDMSYMLKHKIAKCSEFGKVLCARYRPVAAPYFKEYVPATNIKVFDFLTPSPDDIIQERLRKPWLYHQQNTLTVFD